MREEVLNEFEKIEKELMQILSSFTDTQFNTVPFEGSWTAARVAQHLLLASSSALILRGPVKKTDRAPDAGIKKLKSIFLDFTTQLKSPGFIIPEDKIYDKNSLLTALEETAAELTEIIKTTDLTEICMNAPPELGEMTRLELIRFISFHTQRHTHQLKNIYKQVTD
ncbi:MAG TPA: DinB family protein [Sphingobacteriaceae bacterium]|nr:DinB family protein [Sphingobacteriaceae bacterium]